MEQLLLNIDSKYRDIVQYPKESKFTYVLDKTIKNITCVKMISIELGNTTNIIDSTKNNNYITIHLPNILSDPSGTIVQLNNGLIQGIDQITNSFNVLLNNNFNSTEKYFYVFYLNTNLTITFDFNVVLQSPLIINSGWNSVYGLVKQIQNYITLNYNARKAYILANPTTPPIPLDSGNFIMNGISMNVYDRRFRSTNINIDCIRVDTIPGFAYITNLAFNLNQLKNNIYKYYINDIVNFALAIAPSANNGILDDLNCGNYSMPSGYYISGLLTSNSIYHTGTQNGGNNIMYNLKMTYNTKTLIANVNNNFSDLSFYFVNNNEQTWNDTTNTLTNLLDKSYLLANDFITANMYYDTTYIPNLNKDIASFDIDFATNSMTGSIDVNSPSYPSVGYYLGYRPVGTNFVLSSSWDDTESILMATKVFNTTGNNYLFLRINDWGFFDFFNRKVFTKVLLSSSYGNTTLGYGNYLLTDNRINTEYVFRQPTNIKRLDIELVDYLGNTIDLNGVDFSFTLELDEQYDSDKKSEYERRNLVFHK